MDASSSKDNPLRIEHLDQPERVDRLAAALFPTYSRSRIVRMIERGDIRLNGACVDKKMLAKNGDTLSLEVSTEDGSGLMPDEMDLDIVYECADFAIINKPAGLTVHPTPQEGGNRGTLVNGLLHRYPSISQTNTARPGIVHRLDRDTSGLIIVALTPESLTDLQRLMHDRLIKKTYLALVSGSFEEQGGFIESLIGRDPRDPIRMTVRDPIGGRIAKTRFRTVRPGPDGTTLVEVDLLTGRTHQIRVHMASIGHPIIGDRVYGNTDINERFEKNSGLARQWLHAHRLIFEYQGNRYEFCSEPPAELQEALGE
ncbi:MAG TPA: RluA family pseudouridine synthase [bacterium]|nr:RluA family pseudouridine synthase [bacterium]